jgi:hypothetical protein
MIKKSIRFSANRIGEEFLTMKISCLVHGNDTSVEGAVARIKSAIAKWAETEEGQAAIEESCHDFNFGDLSLYQDTPSLVAALEAQGVQYLTLETEEELEAVSFDTVLCPIREDF